jgi:hypothetical protein
MFYNCAYYMYNLIHIFFLFNVPGLTFTAEIPGGVYSHLEKVGLIPKNLLGFNDVINRWVANESVIYTTDIQGG